VSILFVAASICWPVKYSFSLLSNPIRSEHVKPVLSYLAGHYRSEDVIYVYYGARKAFEYYAPRYKLEDTRVILGEGHRATPRLYIDQLTHLVENKRVWLFFSHIYKNEDVLFLDFMFRKGKILQYSTDNQAAVYLFDLGPQDTRDTRDTDRDTGDTGE
jgi:hypothetical protein